MTEGASDEVARDFAGALHRLAEPEGALVPGQLVHLSHANADELVTWRKRWPRIEPARRTSLAQSLVDATEADVHLDFEPIFRCMLDDEEAEVRAIAIDGLWEARDPRLIERYVEILRKELVSAVRARAAAALGEFVRREELGELAQGRTEAAVTALIDVAAEESEDFEVRRRAMESAGFADRREVGMLIERQIESDVEELRAGALRAMGNSADERWESTVLQWLDAHEAQLRFEAARAAGELLVAAALPALAALAAEDEIEIREQAIWAMGEIGGAQARELLERIAEDEEDETLLELIEDAVANAALGEGELDLFSFDPFADPARLDEEDERGD